MNAINNANLLKRNGNLPIFNSMASSETSLELLPRYAGETVRLGYRKGKKRQISGLPKFLRGFTLEADGCLVGRRGCLCERAFRKAVVLFFLLRLLTFLT